MAGVRGGQESPSAHPLHGTPAPLSPRRESPRCPSSICPPGGCSPSTGPPRPPHGRPGCSVRRRFWCTGCGTTPRRGSSSFPGGAAGAPGHRPGGGRALDGCVGRALLDQPLLRVRQEPLQRCLEPFTGVRDQRDRPAHPPRDLPQCQLGQPAVAQRFKDAMTMSWTRFSGSTYLGTEPSRRSRPADRPHTLTATVIQRAQHGDTAKAGAGGHTGPRPRKCRQTGPVRRRRRWPRSWRRFPSRHRRRRSTCGSRSGPRSPTGSSTALRVRAW